MRVFWCQYLREKEDNQKLRWVLKTRLSAMVDDVVYVLTVIYNVLSVAVAVMQIVGGIACLLAPLQPVGVVLIQALIYTLAVTPLWELLTVAARETGWPQAAQAVADQGWAVLQAVKWKRLARTTARELYVLVMILAASVYFCHMAEDTVAWEEYTAYLAHWDRPLSRAAIRWKKRLLQRTDWKRHRKRKKRAKDLSSASKGAKQRYRRELNRRRVYAMVVHGLPEHQRRRMPRTDFETLHRQWGGMIQARGQLTADLKVMLTKTEQLMVKHDWDRALPLSRKVDLKMKEFRRLRKKIAGVDRRLTLAVIALQRWKIMTEQPTVGSLSIEDFITAMNYSMKEIKRRRPPKKEEGNDRQQEKEHDSQQSGFVGVAVRSPREELADATLEADVLRRKAAGDKGEDVSRCLPLSYVDPDVDKRATRTEKGYLFGNHRDAPSNATEQLHQLLESHADAFGSEFKDLPGYEGQRFEIKLKEGTSRSSRKPGVIPSRSTSGWMIITGQPRPLDSSNAFRGTTRFTVTTVTTLSVQPRSTLTRRNGQMYACAAMREGSTRPRFGIITLCQMRMIYSRIWRTSDTSLP